MNIKQTYSVLAFAIAVLWMALSLSSCLGSRNESETIVTNYSNATLKTFSFNNNDGVCKGLSNYAFTIDHFGKSDPDLAAQWPGAGIIFNSDSLPMGAVPDTIEVKMTYSTPSAVKFYHYDEHGTLVDSVDFTEKQVVDFAPYALTRLHLVAYDRRTSKDYLVKVNVHKTVGDTICWGVEEENLFPELEKASFRADTIGRTLFVLMATKDSSVYLSSCAMDYPLRDWTGLVKVGSLKELDPSTLWSLDNRLYCVGDDGALRYSTNGEDWIKAVNPDGLTFVNLLGVQLKASGAACDSLKAIVKVGEQYRFASAADADGVWKVGNVLPEKFPVTGYTRPVATPAAVSKGNRTSRIYVTGGTTKDAELTSSTWTCDGQQWAELEQVYLPPMAFASIVEYCVDTDQPGTLWIMAPGYGMGGTLYFSENRGVTWKKLQKEYPSYADLGKTIIDASPSMYFDPEDYRIYLFAMDKDQKMMVVSGQLTKLTFQHRR